MIDLHCHMLPGIDDGAQTLDDSLAMARAAVADGTTTLACTPHIYPGLFDNTPQTIAIAHATFMAALRAENIPLNIVLGSDIQIVPDLVSKLRTGRVLTLNGGRYFLFEPPHHVPAPMMLELVHSTLAAGFVPVITHPERLAYAATKYNEFREAAKQGAWLQVTGAALTGRFGPGAQKLSERMLADGLVHIIASDGHNMNSRPPTMAAAYARAAQLVGDAEAQRLCIERPQAIVDNVSPKEVAPPLPEKPRKTKGLGLLSRFKRQKT